jgi:transcriptional regulator with XRE-family HTH domain
MQMERPYPNKVAAHRKRKELSLLQLAEFLGMGARQLTYIEAGVSPISFNNAIQLCELFGISIDKLFPNCKEALKYAKSNGDTFEKLALTDDVFQEKMAIGGIDVDPRDWHFKYRLKGCDARFLRIHSASYRYLFRTIQRTSPHDSCFVVFDTFESRIILNLDHLVFCHFIFEPAHFTADRNEEDDEPENESIRVHFANVVVPELFSIDPDYAESEDIGDFDYLVSLAELYSEEQTQTFHFTDEDGEVVFLNADEVALMEIPLWAFNANFLESEHDDD